MERLCQIVVSACVEACHFVGYFRAPGQHEDRRRAACVSVFSKNVYTLAARQFPVQDDDVVVVSFYSRARVCAVADDLTLMFLTREPTLNYFGKCRIVFDYEYFGHG